jgi:hypothetical protein
MNRVSDSIRDASLTDWAWLALLVIGVASIALALEYSSLSRSRYFRWAYWDAPGQDHVARRTASRRFAWATLSLGVALGLGALVAWIARIFV